MYSSREERNKFLSERFQKQLKGRKILNVGGGGERHLEKFLPPSSDYTEVDITGSADIKLNLEKDLPLPSPDNSYDVVVCTDVLEHLDNFHAVLDELARVAKDYIIISLPNSAAGIYLGPFYRESQKESLEGEVTYRKFYGLPLEPPVDRHKWFFSYVEAKRFFDSYARKKNLVKIDEFGIEFPSKHHFFKEILKKAFSFIFSENEVKNMFFSAYWCVLEKPQAKTEEKGNGRPHALFFWIPKVAGTSMNETLQRHGGRKLKNKSEYKNFTNKGWVTFDHVDVKGLLKKRYVSEEFFASAFKFTFVRNPWDRLVSLYHYWNCDKKMSFEEFVKFLEKKMRRRETPWGKFCVNYLYRLPVLSFVSEWGLKLLKRLKIAAPLPLIGPKNIYEFSQANPQTHWLYDEKGNLLVDFVGKYENLSADVGECFQILGIEDEIGKYNTGNRGDYREYYTEETMKIVEKLYADDIEKFDYRFE